MDKIYNVLVAQTSMEEKQMDYIRKEAAKGEVEINNMKKVLSVREVQKCLKETENGEPKYNVLIIQQQLNQSKELVSAEDLKKMRMTVPGLRILLCTSKDMEGSTYLQQVFEAGVYTAFYEEDGTMKNIVDLIRNGRSADNAIDYYHISRDNPEIRKQIGYIEKERLKKLLTLVHNAKDSEIDDVLQHIRTMLAKKEILYLIRNMGEDDVERIFFKKGMGVYFNLEKYRLDKEEQDSAGLLKRFKKTELLISDYILEPDELDARIELVNIKRKAREDKERQKKELEREALAKQVMQMEQDMEQEDFENETLVTTSETVSDSKEEESSNVSAMLDADTNVAATHKSEPTEDERLAALQTLFGKNMDVDTATALLQALQQNGSHQEHHDPKEKTIEETQADSEKDIVDIDTKEDTHSVENENKSNTTSVETVSDDIPDDTFDEEEELVIITPDIEEGKPDNKNKGQSEKKSNTNAAVNTKTVDIKPAKEIDLETEDVDIEVHEEVVEEENQKIKEQLADLAKTPLVFSPLTIKDENVKNGKLYYVISGGKHSGATTMSSVLAYTYKHRNKDKKVCVCSYDGNIEDYANLIEEELSDSNFDIEAGKLSYKNVDFYVIKRSEILRLRREYDAIFVDMKGIGQFNKAYKKESVFLIAQGSIPQIRAFRKNIAMIKEIGFSNISVITAINKFDEEQENEIGKLLNCPIYNIGYLHSATQYCRNLRNSF